MFSQALLALFVATLLIAPIVPQAVATGDTDPAAPGPFAVTRAEYNFPQGTKVSTSHSTTTDTASVPFNGSVHFPTTGDGPFPLLVFMHGRHGTCKTGSSETLANCRDMPLDWPLTGILPPPSALYGSKPIDSYRGYDYVAANLASHGYVVVSVNANAINSADNGWSDLGITARAELILRTIDQFATLDSLPRLPIAPPNGALGFPDFVPGEMFAVAGRIDMTRIGLMGHSRGGDGVTRAIELNNANFDGKTRALKGVFAIAPTDFDAAVPKNVAYATLEPYCDGDVSDLQGARFYDDSRYASETTPSPKMQITVMGADHNFYNTIWWYDDVNYSFPGDAYCGVLGTGAGRMTGDDQRRGGLDLIAAFLRGYVGGETQFLSYFTGASPWPSSICPGGVGTCPDRYHMTYMAPAGKRLVIEDGAGSALTTNDLGGATTATGFASAGVCTCGGVSRASLIALGWNGGAATYTTQIPAAKANWSAFTALTMRTAVLLASPAGQAQDFRVVVTDTYGNAASVHAGPTGALYYPPGQSARKVVPNEARFDLSAFTGVDFASVASVSLVFDATPSGLVGVEDIVAQNEA